MCFKIAQEKLDSYGSAANTFQDKSVAVNETLELLIKYSYPNGLFGVLIHRGTKRSLKGKLVQEPHQTRECVLGGGCSFQRLPKMKSKTHAGRFEKKYLRNLNRLGRREKSLWDAELNYDLSGCESPGRKSKTFPFVGQVQRVQRNGRSSMTTFQIYVFPRGTATG